MTALVQLIYMEKVNACVQSWLTWEILVIAINISTPNCGYWASLTTFRADTGGSADSIAHDAPTLSYKCWIVSWVAVHTQTFILLSSSLMYIVMYLQVRVDFPSDDFDHKILMILVLWNKQHVNPLSLLQKALTNWALIHRNWGIHRNYETVS